MSALNPAADGTRRRQIYLDRRVCTATPERIDIHPARSLVVLPLMTLLLGVSVFPIVYFFSASLPLWLLALLTLSAVVIVPTSGLGFVYSLVGADIVIERRKESAVLQQGFLGMGVGTQELIPFWKIDHLQIDELMPRQEDFSQYEIAIIKVSGKRVPVGTVTVVRSAAKEGLSRAREVADLIAEMAGTRVQVDRNPRRLRTGSG